MAITQTTPLTIYSLMLGTGGSKRKEDRHLLGRRLSHKPLLHLLS